MTYEQEYLNLCKKVLDEGVWVYNERTNTRCLTIPEHTFTYGEDIPLLSTKRSFPVSAWAEKLGYLRKYQWADHFDSIGAKTWYGNANETEAWLNNPNRLGENHIGQVYGASLYDGELEGVLDKLSKHKDDRGLIINYWKPEKFHLGALKPCMYSHNFSIIGDTLHLTSSQRSCDLGLGVNFNSLQVWFLREFFSHITGLKKGVARHVLTNVHIYESHIKSIEEQLSRKPENIDVNFKISSWVKTFKDLTDVDVHAREYFTLEGYNPQSKIEMKMVA